MPRIIRAEDLCNCPTNAPELCSDTCKHRRPWGTGKSLAQRYIAQRIAKALSLTDTLRAAEQRVKSGGAPQTVFAAQGVIKRARRMLADELDKLTVEELTAYSERRKG